jgi:hypothetical protein
MESGSEAEASESDSDTSSPDDEASDVDTAGVTAGDKLLREVTNLLDPVVIEGLLANQALAGLAAGAL